MTVDIPLDNERVRKNLFIACGISAAEEELLKDCTLSEISKSIDGKELASLPGIAALLKRLKGYRKTDPALHAIDILAKRMPKILYFESYDRMCGKVSIDDLRNRIGRSQQLTRSENLFLTFLEFAETTLEQLTSFKKAEEFFAKLEGKGNVITKKVFKYWRQNRNLEVRFVITDGHPDDPAPFNSGKVFHTRIFNRLHQATLDFDERSAGFTWFFSFLVQFSQVKKKHGNVIILLDEPGLSLHGKAQADLLRFIDEELKPHHQVIYTTHSPFMVPSDKLATVRTVEDVVIEKQDKEIEVLGTKVSTDVLKVGRDTLFPLQAALGYEISQSLWVGPHVLLVEGPSDILYLQVASHLLKHKKRICLDGRWTLCPAGSIDKVGAFLSLFSGHGLNIAVLVDYAVGQKGKVEHLKQLEILQRGKVFTTADFTRQTEADIEDFWGTALYLSIVNHAFNLTGASEITPAKLAGVTEKSLRIVKLVEAYFRENAHLPEFDHFTPAEWLLRNPLSIDGISSLNDALNRFEEFFKKVNTLL
jgi:predicted ATPase